MGAIYALSDCLRPEITKSRYWSFVETYRTNELSACSSSRKHVLIN
jgi:hypothetical protein